VGAFALRDLVLVVRELQVDAAGMDVDGVAQVGGGHRRAFDMPARAAAAPGRFPAGQVVAGWLPQHEIAGVALVRGHLDAGAGQHFVRVAPRQLAVAVEGGDREQHVAFGGIGVPGLDQPLDHGDDLRDMGGGFGLDVRRRHAQCGHVVAVGGGEAVGDRRDPHPLFAGRCIDLVIDVGDVAGVAQAAEAAPQQAREHPEHHRAAGVADMHVVVDGRAAHVHGRGGRVQRGERLQLPGQGVVQVQGHGRAVGAKTEPAILAGRGRAGTPGLCSGAMDG